MLQSQRHLRLVTFLLFYPYFIFYSIICLMYFFVLLGERNYHYICTADYYRHPWGSAEKKVIFGRNRT